VQDEKIGGGRIIGEACHFVDTIQYLDGSKLIDLNIQFLNNDAFSKKDNCIINLKFESGAIGNVLYTSMGSKKYPKERLKVFSDGIVYELDNYIKLIRYGNRKKTSFKLKQDKGLEKEYRYISNVILGKQENNSVDDAFVGMKMLLKSWSN
jgi:predicted dehydrogenase